MAISIIVSDLVRFKVAGVINTDTGASQPFDFWLTMSRLRDTAEAQSYLGEIRDRAESATPITDALAPRVRAWNGVTGVDGAELPCTEEHVRELLNMVGMAAMVHTSYLQEAGAKAKN